MTISEQPTTNLHDSQATPPKHSTIAPPSSTNHDLSSAPSPSSTPHGSLQPTPPIDINQTILIDVITGEIMKDPCTSDCGCHLTLSRKTWMTLPTTDGYRKCPNPSCKKEFKSLAINWFAASVLNTKGCITPKEHFEQQKKLQNTEKLLKEFDFQIEQRETEAASELLNRLQQVLPSDSEDLQSRTHKLFEQKEIELKKRRREPVSPTQETGTKKQKTTHSKELSKHQIRVLAIRKKREQAIDLAIKKEVLESMMPKDKSEKQDQSTTPEPESSLNFPPLVTLTQIFSEIGTKDTYSTYDILTFVSELIESKRELTSKQKRDIIDPLWRDCFIPTNTTDLNKHQLNQLLTTINRGYGAYVTKYPFTGGAASI